MYFRNFGSERFTIGGQEYYIQDLTAKVAFTPDQDFNGAYLAPIDIQDEERPDMLAHRIYDDVAPYWTFFIINNITPNDWPVSYHEFDRFMNEKYTKDEQNAVHHYEDVDGNWLPSVGWHTWHDDKGTLINYTYGRGENFNHPEPAPGVSLSNGVRVSLYEYLYAMNEARRRIKIIEPRYVQSFINDFTRKLQEPVAV